MQPEFFNFKIWLFWVIIIMLYALITYVSNTFIFTDSFYYAILFDKIEMTRIKEMIALQHKFQILGYLFIPIYFFLKLWIIAGIIYTGLYLLKQDVSYKNCLKITLIAELVLVVAMLIKTAWLMIDKPSNANDLQYFSPLSITQLLLLDNLPKYLFYPLQLFNVFEVAYWFVLAFGIMAFTRQKVGKSLKIVASSYGVALFIWAVFVVFIQVQFT